MSAWGIPHNNHNTTFTAITAVPVANRVLPTVFKKAVERAVSPMTFLESVDKGDKVGVGVDGNERNQHFADKGPANLEGDPPSGQESGMRYSTRGLVETKEEISNSSQPTKAGPSTITHTGQNILEVYSDDNMIQTTVSKFEGKARPILTNFRNIDPTNNDRDHPHFGPGDILFLSPFMSAAQIGEFVRSMGKDRRRIKNLALQNSWWDTAREDLLGILVKFPNLANLTLVAEVLSDLSLGPQVVNPPAVEFVEMTTRDVYREDRVQVAIVAAFEARWVKNKFVRVEVKSIRRGGICLSLDESDLQGGHTREGGQCETPGTGNLDTDMELENINASMGNDDGELDLDDFDVATEEAQSAAEGDENNDESVE